MERINNRKVFYVGILVTIICMLILLLLFSISYARKDLHSYCGYYICSVHNTVTFKEYQGISIISKRKAKKAALGVCRSEKYPDKCVVNDPEKCRFVTDRNMETG